MFVIVEKIDVGSRETIYAYELSTESVYGGDFLPSFTSEKKANEYLSKRKDNFRKFKVVQLRSI